MNKSFPRPIFVFVKLRVCFCEEHIFSFVKFVDMIFFVTLEALQPAALGSTLPLCRYLTRELFTVFKFYESTNMKLTS